MYSMNFTESNISHDREETLGSRNLPRGVILLVICDDRLAYPPKPCAPNALALLQGILDLGLDIVSHDTLELGERLIKVACIARGMIQSDVGGPLLLLSHHTMEG